MKIEGFSAPGTAKGAHKGWIELQSCQLGSSRGRSVSESSGEAKTPTVSEIVVTKFQDDTSSELFRQSLYGQGQKITIEFTNKDGDAPYFTLELKDALVSSYSVSGHGSDRHDSPLETLTFNFTKIEYQSKAAPDSGNAQPARENVAWDLTQERGY